MESLGALMMVTALAWPMIGGALVGLIGGIVKGHGLIGTLVNVVLCGILGFALVMGFMAIPNLAALVPEQAAVPLTLGLPILGGLIGLWVKGRFAGA